jgi:putative transposase
MKSQTATNGPIVVMTNDVKCHDIGSIDFIIGSPKLFSCTEAAKVQPEGPDPPAHDAFTRLLLRLEPDPETL